MNTAPMKVQEIKADGYPNPNYAAMCGRDLSIEMSKYDAIMKSTRAELIILESESSAAREAGVEYAKIGELGETRIKFLHAVRQIVRVREEQVKRGAGKKSRGRR
jgi:hypothetical protein